MFQTLFSYFKRSVDDIILLYQAEARQNARNMVHGFFKQSSAFDLCACIALF